MKMVKILVLYYTRTGNTEALAKAVAEGAKSVEGVSVIVKRVDYATVQDFVSCDAVAFGSPNYFDYMSGLMKDFFDRALSFKDMVKGKPAAAFTSGGSSSNSALLSLERMIDSFGLVKVAEGVVSSGKPTDRDLEKCRDLGRKLAESVKKR